MTSLLNTTPNERLFKALTGVSFDEFRKLLGAFENSYHELRDEAYQRNRATRQRKPGGGQKGKLRTMADKLYFVLYYWKNYATFDVLGDHFGFDRSSANRNVHKLWPALERALDTLGMLPARRFESFEELRAAWADIEAILIDATERGVERPQDDEAQRKKYSGKKKRHTVKNTVITSLDRFILFLGYTVDGSQHDYGLFKEEFPPSEEWFNTLKVWVDLGYLGIRKAYGALEIFIPHKTPRKSKANPEPSLTEEQKAENREQSRVRVVVEHAIGGMKRFAILVNRYRNRKAGFVDTVALIGAGLWNWKLTCRPA